jgi:hypothetical protein
MTRERWLLAISLANLAFLRSWSELFQFRAGDEADTAAARSLLWATLASTALLAAALLAARRLAGEKHSTAARIALLLLIVTPIDFLAGQLWQMSNGALPRVPFLAAWTAILLLPILAAVALGIYRRAGPYRAFRTVSLILFPLPLIFTANMVWASYVAAPPPKTPLAGPMPESGTHRILWLVFDEFDYHLAFRVRPPSIRMPELDRLRTEGFFAHRATAPAGDTLESMTSYLLGRTVTKLDPTPDRVRAELDTGETVAVAAQPTVLSHARALGYDTFIAGWHLPYCPIFGGHTTDCAQMSPGAIRPSGFAENFRRQWRQSVEEHWLVTRLTPGGRLREPWVGWGLRVDQYLAYRLLLRRGLEMATGESGRLVFIHFPIPHPLGIYSRKTGELSLDTSTNSIDNLELVDRTVGRFRRVLEQMDAWDHTTLIITSDHPMRPEVWNGNASWTEEEQQLTGNQRRDEIPVLVKLAGSNEPAESHEPFSTVALSALTTELLAGRVTTAEQAAEFLAHPAHTRR